MIDSFGEPKLRKAKASFMLVPFPQQAHTHTFQGTNYTALEHLVPKGTV